jgi:hypothetical protein
MRSIPSSVCLSRVIVTLVRRPNLIVRKYEGESGEAMDCAGVVGFGFAASDADRSASEPEIESGDEAVHAVGEVLPGNVEPEGAIAALILGLGLVFGAVAHGFCVVHHHDYFGIDRGARWWFGGDRGVCWIFGCGAIAVVGRWGMFWPRSIFDFHDI